MVDKSSAQEPAGPAVPADSSPPRRGRVYAFVFGFCGVICLVIAAAFTYRSWNWSSQAQRTVGKVIGLSGKKSKAPIVTYEVAGQTYQVTGNFSSSPAGYATGDEVAVLYFPDKPANGQIASFGEMWFPPVGLAILGSVFTAVAVIERRKPKPAPI